MAEAPLTLSLPDAGAPYPLHTHLVVEPAYYDDADTYFRIDGPERVVYLSRENAEILRDYLNVRYPVNSAPTQVHAWGEEAPVLTIPEPEPLAEWEKELLGLGAGDSAGSLLFVTGDTDGWGHYFKTGTQVEVVEGGDRDYLQDGTYEVQALTGDAEIYFVGANDLDVQPPAGPLFARGDRVRLADDFEVGGGKAGAVAYVTQDFHEEDGFVMVAFVSSDPRRGQRQGGGYVPDRFVPAPDIEVGDRVWIDYDVSSEVARSRWTGPATVRSIWDDDGSDSILGRPSISVTTDKGLLGAFDPSMVSPLKP